jgi:UDP-N-acetylmuramoyl-L-alanyl-D-glutamate--2,6-diaminopimelate ligase
VPAVAELVEQLAPFGARLARGDGATPVVDLTHDSRRAGPGVAFAAVTGAVTDGHDHAGPAVAAGAPALLVERELDLDVVQIVVDDVRRALGPAAAFLHGRPAERLLTFGVTGTNGKTTVVALLGSILERAGRHPAVLGTLSGARTTPEGTDLQRDLAGFVADGRDSLAMEVSSHALALHRVDGMHFDVAVFTNLSPEHLDFHHDLDAYFEAKALLFTGGRSRHAVLPLDQPWGARLAERTDAAVHGYTAADAAEVEIGAGATTFRWRDQLVRLPLVGRFNVRNALAAATAAAAAGLADDVIAAGLTATPPVRGRFELVPGAHPFTVLVDYAHTPDALAKALAAARELVTGPGKLRVVFGCGGDRDRAKRPLMGRAAEEAADDVVITSDNPRSEDPDEIIRAVRAGLVAPERATVEPDRGAAIRLALGRAGPGDVVLLAGKGHETTQTTGDRVIPFDDRDVAADALRAAGW